MCSTALPKFQLSNLNSYNFKKPLETKASFRKHRKKTTKKELMNFFFVIQNTVKKIKRVGIIFYTKGLATTLFLLQEKFLGRNNIG